MPTILIPSNKSLNIQWNLIGSGVSNLYSDKKNSNVSDQERYRIFISHAWDYGSEYQRLVNLLNNAPNFSWQNYSVPKDSPIHNAKSKNDIEMGLSNHIKPAQIVIVLAGMYASHSDWMQIELELAEKMGKHIIGIKPFGAEKIPLIVQDTSDEMVGWNTQSIINTIKILHSGEDAQAKQILDFIENAGEGGVTRREISHAVRYKGCDCENWVNTFLESGILEKCGKRGRAYLLRINK